MRTDPWKILGIPKGSEKKEVTAAYRKLVKKWHPDVNSSSRAEKKWEEITWAYDILINDKPVPLFAVEPGIEHTFVSFFSTPPRLEVPIMSTMPEGSRISCPIDGEDREVIFTVDTSPGDIRVCSTDQEMVFLVLVEPESPG